MRLPSVDALLREVHEKDEKILKLKQEIRCLRQRLSEESLKLSLAERKLLNACHEALRTSRVFAQKELALKEREKHIRAKIRREGPRKICDRSARRDAPEPTAEAGPACTREKKEVRAGIDPQSARNRNTCTDQDSTSFSLSISGKDICDAESRISAVLEENRRLIKLAADHTPRKKPSSRDNLIEYLNENGIKSMLGLRMDGNNDEDSDGIEG